MNAIAIVILAAVAYFAMLTASLLLSQPLRVRVQHLGADLLEKPNLSKQERAFVAWLMESSTSTVVGLMLPVAGLYMLAGQLLGAVPKRDSRAERLHAMPEYDRLMRNYVGSIMACSPLATLIALPFMIVAGIVRAARGDRHLIDAVEEPVMKASAAFQPA